MVNENVLRGVFFVEKNLHISKKSSTFAADLKSNDHFGNADYKFISYAIL